MPGCKFLSPCGNFVCVFLRPLPPTTEQELEFDQGCRGFLCVSSRSDFDLNFAFVIKGTCKSSPPPLGGLRAAAWNSSCHVDYVLFVGWVSSALTAQVFQVHLHRYVFSFLQKPRFLLGSAFPSHLPLLVSFSPYKN